MHAAEGSSTSQACGPVIPIHVSVQGRARLRVRGLHKAPRIKSLLESELFGAAGIRSVSADVWTGNVLVLYEGISVELLVAKIELLLGSESLAPEPKPEQAAIADRGSWFERLSTSVRRSERADGGDRHAGLLPPVPAQPSFRWHAKTVIEVVNAVGTSVARGLTAADARERLATYGPNSLPEPPRRSALAVLANQLKSLPVLLLLGSAVLSIATGGVADATVILLVVAMNATIGCVTEVQAEKTIATLTKVREPRVKVIRDGEVTLVEAPQVTMGDVLLLTPGTYIAADARLAQANDLTVAESILTGESLPVLKSTDTLAEDVLALGDRSNMVYCGTVVTGGSGIAIVIAVGANTEVGRIQALIATALRPQTPLERQLETLGRQMVWISSAVCGLVFLVGMLRGLGFLQMLRTAVSLAVAAVPEGLPTVATTTLSFGLWRLRKHNIVARHLDAIETLGSIQVICLDKTGTITLNRMVVVEASLGKQSFKLHGEEALAPEQAARNAALTRLLQTVVLCNDAETVDTGGVVQVEGSGTESALLRLALAYGIDIDQLRQGHPRFRVEHRTEQQAVMATWHHGSGGRWIIAAKGSPGDLLRHCGNIASGGKVKRLTPKQRAEIEAENERMAGEALRVLGVAWAEGEGETSGLNGDLTWLGLVGIADPPRKGMRNLMSAFHRAGIDTRVITGDQRMTAYAIGKRLGLSRSGRKLEVVDGTAVNEEPNGDLPDAHVFARVNPSDKLHIVRAMQARGQVVAMTGDGVNDGPALKAADVGVVLGKAGAETAREVADLVLMDDDLQSLITAIREGRAIYEDIQRSVHYITATNLSEILTMLGSVSAGFGQPLTARQLLWINVLTDVLPCLALAVEPPHADVMQRAPRDPQAALVTGRDYLRLGRQGAVMTAAGMGGYLYALARYGAGPQASTMAFLSLTAAQLLHAFSARSDQPIAGGDKLPSNRYLPLAIGGSLALEVLAMVFPPLRALLGLAPIGIIDALVCLTAGVTSLAVNEAFKLPNKEPLRALPAGVGQLVPTEQAA